MQPRPGDGQLDAARGLIANPMFQLSTAGQELFHSNMLYWLAANRPIESLAVWRALGLDGGGSDCFSPSVRREWRHIDLLLEIGERKLVLENKVGAIPSRTQLVTYWQRLRNDRRFNESAVRFVLLTLIPPALNLPAPWKHVGYADLLPGLEQTARALNGREAALIGGYAGLVRQLVQVIGAFDPVRNLEAPRQLDPSVERVLREGRLLPLILKMQASRCAGLIAERLDNLMQNRRTEVEAGLTNSMGLNSWFTPEAGGRRFGWQAQGGQFRLVGIVSEERLVPRVRREAMMEAEHHGYFDFSELADLGGGLLRPYVGRKEWCGYEPDFVYRYQHLLPTVTWRQYVDLAVAASQRACAYVDRA